MSDLLKGKVKFFDKKNRWGFLLTEYGDVFFHYQDGTHLHQTASGPAFSGEKSTRSNGVRFPDPGDEVLYRLEETPRGLRAIPWGLPEELK